MTATPPEAAAGPAYEIPAEAVRAAAAARRCMWSMPMEDHPDGPDCEGMCMKAAKLALDAAAPFMVAPLQARIAKQDAVIVAVLDLADSIGRSLSREGAAGTEADYALFGFANRIRETVTTITEGKS